MDYFNLRNELDAANRAAYEAESDDRSDVESFPAADDEQPGLPEDQIVQIPESVDPVMKNPETKYRKLQITIDSFFRDYQSPSSTHFFHTFPTPIKNVTKLRIMGIEYSYGSYPFNINRGNVSLKVNGVSYSIPVGYYATVAHLVSTLNAVLTANSVDLEFSQYTPSMRVKITTTSVTPVQVSFAAVTASQTLPTLGQALGFLYPGYVVTASQPARGERLPSTDVDRYFLLQLDGVGAGLHGDIVPFLQKIQLPASSWGSTIMIDSGVTSVQDIAFSQPVTLRKWEFRLLDAWGKLVDNNDLPISLTIELTQAFDSGVAEHRRLDPIATPGAQ